MTTEPDLIIINGALISFDADSARTTALAITGQKISALGQDAEMLTLAGQETRIFDAQGATVMPGFIDSHVHLFGGSVELGYLDLTEVAGLNALTTAIAPYATENPGDAIPVFQGDAPVYRPEDHFKVCTANHSFLFNHEAPFEYRFGKMLPPGTQVTELLCKTQGDLIG